MGWVEGFEPSTAGATVRSSTTELHPPYPKIITSSNRAVCEELGGFALSLWRCDGSKTLAVQLSEQPPPIMQQLDCPQPAEAAGAPLLVLTENVESCGSSLWVWQRGHSAFCSPKRMASNLFPHCSQRYSKIGIATPIDPGKRKCKLAHTRIAKNDKTIIDAAA